MVVVRLDTEKLQRGCEIRKSERTVQEGLALIKGQASLLFNHSLHCSSVSM